MVPGYVLQCILRTSCSTADHNNYYSDSSSVGGGNSGSASTSDGHCSYFFVRNGNYVFIILIMVSLKL